jgi:hypothetical protein
MPDHPIIFSGQMVRALLDGRKTQTRRLAWRKPQWCAGVVSGCYITDPSPWQRVQPGDRLWVRESGAWSDGVAAYAATDTKPPSARWRPSTHMPRWASRITLHVEEVRVERLQAISEEDAGAEGVTDFAKLRAIAPHEDLAECQTRLRWRQREFALLWNTLHGPGAWEANPEVVVLQFRVERREH